MNLDAASDTSGTRPLAGAGPRARRRTPAATTPLPASGAWREGDHPGRRAFAHIGPISLETGSSLPEVTVAYETWGTLDPDGGNAILVLHALTGDSHVTGEIEPGHVSPGWWQEMVGPGRPIDTNRFFVVAPNVLGGCQGTTGPASLDPSGRPWGGRFPRVTVRDQVTAEIALTKQLGITSWEFVVGASMGGLRVLEWAIMGPEADIEVRSIGAVACAPQLTGDQIAWAHPQLGVIRADRNFRGGDYYDQPDGEGPTVGLGLARQIAHITYRSADELDERFGRVPQGAEEPLHGGRFAVQSYLDHHGDKLARRFDANSYLVLTESMLTHDLGRDRGGIVTALRSIASRALVVGVDSDRLFLARDSETMARHLEGSDDAVILRSDFGHDGFLIEFDQLGPLVAQFLGSVHARPSS